MPVYRGPDGKIIEEKTDKRTEDTKPTDVANKPLPPAPQGGEQPAGAGRLDAPTQRMGESQCAGQCWRGRADALGGWTAAARR